LAKSFWSAVSEFFKPNNSSANNPKKPSDAVMEARRSILKARLPEDLSNYEICLTDYEDTVTYERLKVKKEWTLKFHREVMQAYAAEVEKRGGTVKQYIIKLQEYASWLERNGLANTDANQKRYVHGLNKKNSE
jgi:hypothetical protein